jgi:hypothetical protein
MQRVQWAREGAASRLAKVEFGLRVIMAAVTDHRETAAAELGVRWELSAADVLQSPYALLGSADSIADAIVQRRERYGFSHFVWDESQLDNMAPVVARLAGR